MQSFRQVGSGLLFGLVCIAIVVGGFALSMAEGGLGAITAPTVAPTQIMTATSVPTQAPTLPMETATEPAIPLTDTPVPTATITYTPPPPPTSCPPPAGWLATYIQLYDTLPVLAQTHRVSIEAIRQGNCLVSDQLVTGSFIYLPPAPTATSVPCGAPANWVTYLVAPGDTLFYLSQRYHISIADLQRANCLGSSTYIQAGRHIKVPYLLPTNTPLASPTITPTFIIIKEETSTPTLPVPTTEVPPTVEPSATNTVPPSDTPPPTATTAPTVTTAPAATATP